MAAVKLSPKAKTYIITALATFERRKDILAGLKEQFDVTISEQGLSFYNPTNPQLHKKWKDLFETTREAFLVNVGQIPIANKAVRLRELNRLFEKQSTGPLQNPAEIRALLEQAAKESGDAFTNRREHTGAGGKSLIPDNASTVVLYLPDNGRGDAGSKPAATPDPAALATSDAEKTNAEN